MKGVVLALCLLAFAMCQGALVNVTSDGPGLAAALNSSSPGDTIVLASGTYEGASNLDLFVTGYNISFTSATGNPADVIIQCNFAFEVFVVNSQISDPHPNAFTFLSVSGITFRDCGLNAGGAFYLETNDNRHAINVEITNCDFRDNVVNSAGGSIYTYSNQAPITLSVDNCNFIGNRAFIGGAIYVYQTSLTISNSFFTGNEVSDIGGALYVDQLSSVTITNSAFLLNRAESALGGAIYAYDIISFSADTVVLRQNSAPDGGAVFLDTITPEPVFTDCTFDQNVAQRGGGIFLYEAAVTLTRNTFSSNQAFYSPGHGGGALAATADSLITASYNLFTANSGAAGGAVDLDFSTANFVSNDFEDNWSQGNGGAFILERESTLTVSYGSILNNTAIGRGSSVYCNASAVTLNSVTIVQSAKAREVNGFVCASTAQNNQASSCAISPADSGDFTNVCSASMLETPEDESPGGGSKSSHKLAKWKLAVIIVGSVVGAALIVSVVAFVVSRRGPTTFLQFS